MFLLQIHNIAAFTLHIIPLMYIWERLIGTHTKPEWIRLPSRLPPLLAVWLLALLFPFYGNITSTYGSITGFLVSHVFPGISFLWFYRWGCGCQVDSCLYPACMLVAAIFFLVAILGSMGDRTQHEMGICSAGSRSGGIPAQ